MTDFDLMSVDVVRADGEMAPSLTLIALEAKRHWGYPDEWMSAWADELTIAESTVERDQTWAAVIDGRPVGFYVLLTDRGTVGRLDHLWVLPGFMGLGVGTSLLQHAIRLGKELELESISIISDPNAELFYLQCGARRVGVEATEVCGEARELPVLAISLT